MKQPEAGRVGWFWRLQQPLRLGLARQESDERTDPASPSTTVTDPVDGGEPSVVDTDPIDAEAEADDVETPPTTTAGDDSDADVDPADEETAEDLGPEVTISSVTLDGDRYSVDFDTTFDPVISNDPASHHLHFFFDSVGVADAGAPGSGPWLIYDGASPFQGYGPGDRPAGATGLCVTVATHDHAVDDAAVFDCMDLPE